jgi:predicted transcriptional regulator
MNNNEIYIGITNELTKYLVGKYGLAPLSTFGDAINRCKNKDRIVKFYFDELNTFLDLRNFLVHEHNSKNILASPTDETLKRIKEIKNKIINPDVVGKIFKSKVSSFFINDTLDKVLADVKEFNYTQFPIFSKDGFVGVLSENGITHWLAQEADNDIISINETKLKDVIRLEEINNNYRLINPNSSIYDLLDIFQKGYKDNNKSLVVLITNKKNPIHESDFTGIVTYADSSSLHKRV